MNRNVLYHVMEESAAVHLSPSQYVLISSLLDLVQINLSGGCGGVVWGVIL